MTGFRIVQGFYWLGLGTWFGAMLMLVIAAAVTFKTVRAHQPTIGVAPYNDPMLAEHHSSILAGGIVGNVLRALSTLQIICAVIVVTAVVLQCTVFADRLAGPVWGAANLLRIALIAVPIVVVAVDRLHITPTVWQHRAVMYDPGQPAESRAQARAGFDRYHKLSERVVGAAMFMLAAAVLVSPFVLHAPRGPAEVIP
jgi:hypothetical protein